jgi:hypothetical protein
VCETFRGLLSSPEAIRHKTSDAAKLNTLIDAVQWKRVRNSGYALPGALDLKRAAGGGCAGWRT